MNPSVVQSWKDEGVWGVETFHIPSYGLGDWNWWKYFILKCQNPVGFTYSCQISNFVLVQKSDSSADCNCQQYCKMGKKVGRYLEYGNISYPLAWPRGLKLVEVFHSEGANSAIFMHSRQISNFVFCPKSDSSAVGSCHQFHRDVLVLNKQLAIHHIIAEDYIFRHRPPGMATHMFRDAPIHCKATRSFQYNVRAFEFPFLQIPSVIVANWFFLFSKIFLHLHMK